MYLKNIEEAEKDYDISFTLDGYPKDSVEYFFERGQFKDCVQDYEGAIKDFDKAIELAPNDSWAYGRRGYSKFCLKDYNNAIEDFNKALELGSEEEDWIYYALGNINLNLKNYNEAILYLTKSLELNNVRDFLYIDRSAAKKELKDFLGAMDDANKAIELKGEYLLYAYCLRADVKYELGDYSGAAEDISNINESNIPTTLGSDAVFYELRGKIKAALGDKEGAEKDFQKAKELK